MNSLKSGVFALCLATMLTGCFKHSFTAGTGGGDVTREPSYETWQHHWFFGIIGEDNIDVKTVCPSGNATIKDEHTFIDGLLRALVGVVWSPTTVRIWCADGSAEGTTTTLVIPAEVMKKAALAPEMVDFVRTVAPASVDTYVNAKRNYEAQVCAVAAN